MFMRTLFCIFLCDSSSVALELGTQGFTSWPCLLQDYMDLGE